MTERYPWPPEYVLKEFLFKSHEKQSNRTSWNDVILRALEADLLSNSASRTGQVFRGGAEIVSLFMRLNFKKIKRRAISVTDFFKQV